MQPKREMANMARMVPQVSPQRKRAAHKTVASTRKLAQMEAHVMNLLCDFENIYSMVCDGNPM